MKTVTKSVMMLAALAAVVSFASCGNAGAGKNAEGETVVEEAAVVEEAVTVAPAADSLPAADTTAVEAPAAE